MESDEDIEDVGGEESKVDEEEEDEDEIIESDIELEGEIVEPDNDPPQKVIYFSTVIYSSYSSDCIPSFLLSEYLSHCRWETSLSRSLKRVVMLRSQPKPKPWKPFRMVIFICELTDTVNMHTYILFLYFEML